MTQAAGLDALKAEEVTQKNRLGQKLNARRKKKMQELKLKEDDELKRKEASDAQRVQVRQ